MNLEVKKVKLIESMSEETPCFTAELWDNGKFVANVSNRGQGGPNDFSPSTSEIYTKYGNLDTECEIMTMVEDYAFVTANQNKSWVLSKDDKRYTAPFPMTITKLKAHSDYSSWLKKHLDKFKADGYKVLNRNI